MEPFFDSYKPDRVIPPEGLDRLLALVGTACISISLLAHVNLAVSISALGCDLPLMKFTKENVIVWLRKRNADFVSTLKISIPKPFGLIHRILHARYQPTLISDGANHWIAMFVKEQRYPFECSQTKCIPSFMKVHWVAAVTLMSAKSERCNRILHRMIQYTENIVLGKFLILLYTDYLKQTRIQVVPGLYCSRTAKMDYKLFVEKKTEYFNLKKLHGKTGCEHAYKHLKLKIVFSNTIWLYFDSHSPWNRCCNILIFLVLASLIACGQSTQSIKGLWY